MREIEKKDDGLFFHQIPKLRIRLTFDLDVVALFGKFSIKPARAVVMDIACTIERLCER